MMGWFLDEAQLTRRDEKWRDFRVIHLGPLYDGPTCQGRRQPHEGIASPRPPLPVGRESKQQAAADAAANYEVAADARARQEANHRMADADVYKTRIDAEADNYAAQKRAEACAVSQIKEAEGIAAHG
ncbi:hypothetical protein E4U37_008343 [Claviceps purpurea]|nr:hypothetical protein E4U37_008343 [Claviceps purpurea]